MAPRAITHLTDTRQMAERAAMCFSGGQSEGSRTALSRTLDGRDRPP